MDQTVTFEFSGQKFSLFTQQKLFSPKQFDLGSKLLLESFQIPPTVKNVLDLGCGWGGIGIALAKLQPEKFVYLIDNDPLAIEISKKNAEINGVRNVKILKADVTYSTFPLRFDLVVSNPPWSKSNSVIPKLVQFAFDHMNRAGQFYLVVNKTYRTELQMQKIFGNVETIVEQTPYKILVSKKL